MLEAGETFGDPNVDTSILNLFKELPNKDNYREPSWLEGTILDATAQTAAEQIARRYFPPFASSALSRVNMATTLLGDLLNPSTAHAPTLTDEEKGL
jgi:hypothetical protein